MMTGIGGVRVGAGANWLEAAWSRRHARGTADLVALQATSETSEQISVATDEGDTVTITLGSEAEASYAFYRQTSASGETTLQAGALVASASSDLEIWIQGDLNEQELSDIASLLEQLAPMIRDAAKGGSLALSGDTPDGQGLDSLAGYSVSVEHSESLELIRVTDRAVLGQGSVESAPSPTAVPALASQGDSPTRSLTEFTELPEENQLAPADHGMTRLLDKMMAAAKESGLELPRLGSLLDAMLRRLVRVIAREPGMAPAERALDEIPARFAGRLRGEPHPHRSS